MPGRLLSLLFEAQLLVRLITNRGAILGLGELPVGQLEFALRDQPGIFDRVAGARLDCVANNAFLHAHLVHAVVADLVAPDPLLGMRGLACLP